MSVSPGRANMEQLYEQLRQESLLPVPTLLIVKETQKVNSTQLYKARFIFREITSISNTKRYKIIKNVDSWKEPSFTPDDYITEKQFEDWIAVHFDDLL